MQRFHLVQELPMTPEQELKAMETLDAIEAGEDDVSFIELLDLARYAAENSPDRRLAMCVLGLTRKMIVLNHRHNQTREIANDCRMWHK